MFISLKAIAQLVNCVYNFWNRIEKLLKFLIKLWESIDPQRNLDNHHDKINKAKISQRLRERLVAEITLAKIRYGDRVWLIIILTILTVCCWIILHSVQIQLTP